MNLIRPRATPASTRPGLEAGLTKFPRSWPLLVFLTIGLGLTMSLSQYFEEEGSGLYLVFLLPVLLLPLVTPMEMLRVIRGKAFSIVIFGIVVIVWQSLRGDFQAVKFGFLLSWGTIWISSGIARIRFDDFYLLYGFTLLLGLFMWLSGDINQWGLLPGTTSAAGESVWRVSFFPNIAYTGFLSLAFIMVFARDIRRKRKFVVVLMGVAIYFIVFSFVRTAMIGLVVFAALAWLFRKRSSPTFMFWVSLLTAIIVNLAIAYSSPIFLKLQSSGVFSRLFLRGETGLSTYEIYQQLYRPWIWGQHLNQFATSPYLMGWGSTDFNQLKTESLVTGLLQTGEISFPTRLLAQYGLAGALFLGFAIHQLAVLARRRDAWGCACFPVVSLAMMHWGTMFHPTDPMFGIYMILLIHGSSAFGPRPPRAVLPGISRRNAARAAVR